MYGIAPILPVELSIPTWAVLPWEEVRTRAELLALRARQLERRPDDIAELEAAAHLQRTRERNKEYFDTRHQTTGRTFEVGDMVLLHDTKLENQSDRTL